MCSALDQGPDRPKPIPMPCLHPDLQLPLLLPKLPHPAREARHCHLFHMVKPLPRELLLPQLALLLQQLLLLLATVRQHGVGLWMFACGTP